MCSTTGALEYGHAPGLDVFPSQSAAVAHLRRRGVCKTVTEGCALLGCAAFGDCALALIAKRVRTAVVLPNGHEVLTVTEAQWVRCALRNPAAVLTREERANVQALADIPLENLYFYCETFDVTRSFAHATDESIASPDGEWVWNEWLASPCDGSASRAVPGAASGIGREPSDDGREGGGVEARRVRPAQPPAPGHAVPGEGAQRRGGAGERGGDGAAGVRVDLMQKRLGVVGDEATDRRRDGTKLERRNSPVHLEHPVAHRWSLLDLRRPRAGGPPVVRCGERLGAGGPGLPWTSAWGQEVKQAIGEADIYIASENPYRERGRAASASRTRARPPGDATDTEVRPLTSWSAEVRRR